MASDEIGWLLNHEPTLRLVGFVAVFTLMAGWERLAPRRRGDGFQMLRWTSNLAIVALNTVLLRLAFPILVVSMAMVCEGQGWGLFNVYAVPLWVAFAGSVILLDLTVYLQHVLFHAVPALWRLHRMHHADLAFDVTTGVRFHPLEIGLSMGIKLGAVVLLGAPAAAVLVFEVLLNATSLFNHANVRIAPGVDRILRWLVVTPDMHRVHHSIHADETNSNFGFNLPWWDRLLGTYRPQPREGHEAMTVGIRGFRSRHDLRLDRMLIQPLRRDSGDYPINQRLPSVS